MGNCRLVGEAGGGRARGVGGHAVARVVHRAAVRERRERFPKELVDGGHVGARQIRSLLPEPGGDAEELRSRVDDDCRPSPLDLLRAHQLAAALGQAQVVEIRLGAIAPRLGLLGVELSRPVGAHPLRARDRIVAALPVLHVASDATAVQDRQAGRRVLADPVGMHAQNCGQLLPGDGDLRFTHTVGPLNTCSH